MSEYKLYYFNARGRGEVVRLVFAAAGQKFEDIRFTHEEWPNHKPKSPTGQSPFVEVTEGGKTFALAQSVSIARFLARRFNLAGTGDQEQAEVDMYVDQITDLINEMAHAHYREKDEARKKELQHKLETETVPNSFTIFEKRLSSTGSGFVAKSGLTYADLYLYAVLEWFGEKKDSALAHFPHLKKLEETVRTHPRIAEWIQKRPVTQN